MAKDRRTHRSHVSYIDKSREYYGAHGYPQPYQWSYNAEVPFAPLAKPLSESCIGLLTTSFFPAGEEPEGVDSARPKKPYAAKCDDALEGLFNSDLSWDKVNTHTDDLDTYLPINRLREMEASGRIGSLSKRFYGIPTDYSHRRTERQDAPKILDWMREDEVDVVLLVPL
jgi:D-proline reductase (dithiol) PrdB